MAETTEVNAPWHVGKDGQAHYVRYENGKALCGFAGVNVDCPRQHRQCEPRAKRTYYVQPCCRRCFQARGEMR